MALLELIRRNLMEFQKKILKISDSNFAATIIDHHALTYIRFNEHCLKNISIPKIEKDYKFCTY